MMEALQNRVVKWVRTVLGLEVLFSKRERTERFVEEAIELAQACDLPKERVQAFIDHVYSRPVGEVYQEIGGVMVTLCALGYVFEKDVETCFRMELNRIENPAIHAKLKEKHDAKPRS